MAKRTNKPDNYPAVRTVADWKAIPEEERQRMITVLANNVNRRYDRMTEAGLQYTPGWETIKALSRMKNGKYAVPKEGHVTKSLKGMTAAEQVTYYKRLVETITPKADRSKESTVTGAKEWLKQGGFSTSTYVNLTLKEKRDFWKGFHAMRDKLRKRTRYVAGKDEGSALRAYIEGMQSGKWRTNRPAEGKVRAVIKYGREHDGRPEGGRGLTIAQLEEEEKMHKTRIEAFIGNAADFMKQLLGI